MRFAGSSGSTRLQVSPAKPAGSSQTVDRDGKPLPRADFCCRHGVGSYRLGAANQAPDRGRQQGPDRGAASRPRFSARRRTTKSRSSARRCSFWTKLGPRVRRRRRVGDRAPHDHDAGIVVATVEAADRADGELRVPRSQRRQERTSSARAGEHEREAQDQTTAEAVHGLHGVARCARARCPCPPSRVGPPAV